MEQPRNEVARREDIQLPPLVLMPIFVARLGFAVRYLQEPRRVSELESRANLVHGVLKIRVAPAPKSQ